MALNLSSISKSTAVKAPRLIVVGPEKIGKTTFAAGAESPVFLPIKGEEGVDGLGVAKFPTLTTFAEVMEAIGALYQEDHEYQTVVIDSVSTLEPLIWDQTCKLTGSESIERVNGGFGKGYIEALKLWREVMDGLDALREHKGMACILIGHVAVRSFTDPLSDPYDTYTFDLNKHASAALLRWADCTLFANNKTVVKKTDAGFNKTAARGVGNDQRVLYTQKRPAHPGGGRHVYGQLPYELPLAWDKFMEAVQSAA